MGNDLFDYENIGEKIKSLAKWIAIIEGLLGIIGGFFCLFNESTIILGLIIIILSPLIAFVSSWLLYGFGQLIENSDAVRELAEKIEKNSTANEDNADRTPQATEKAPLKTDPFVNSAIEGNRAVPIKISEDRIECPRCHTQQSIYKNECWNCQLEFDKTNL